MCFVNNLIVLRAYVCVFSDTYVLILFFLFIKFPNMLSFNLTKKKQHVAHMNCMIIVRGWGDLVCLFAFTIYNWMKMLIRTLDHRTTHFTFPLLDAEIYFFFALFVVTDFFIFSVYSNSQCCVEILFRLSIGTFLTYELFGPFLDFFYLKF